MLNRPNNLWVSVVKWLATRKLVVMGSNQIRKLLFETFFPLIVFVFLSWFSFLYFVLNSRFCKMHDLKKNGSMSKYFHCHLLQLTLTR